MAQGLDCIDQLQEGPRCRAASVLQAIELLAFTVGRGDLCDKKATAGATPTQTVSPLTPI